MKKKTAQVFCGLHISDGPRQAFAGHPFAGNTVLAQYFRMGGTSMAMPVVGGAVSLLLQGQPGLTPDQVKARFMKTAYKTFPVTSTTDAATSQTFVSYYDIFTVGAGYLDVAAALANHDASTGFALSPTAVYIPATNSVTLAGTAAPEGSQSIWGSSVILAGTQSCWRSQSLWGCSTTAGFSGL